MNQTRSSTRGEQTREALVIAAIEIFGRDGFHAGSTRAIARAAGANQALIGYHFGGKNGLYLAAFESIGDQITATVLPCVQGVAEEMEFLESGAPGASARALQCLEAVMSTLVGQFNRSSTSGWPRLVVREQQDPTAAFDILYDRFYQPLLGVITRLVAVLLNVEPASDKARARAMMILGQVFIFLATPATTMRQMQWSQLGPGELEVAREQLLASLRAQFKVEVLL